MIELPHIFCNFILKRQTKNEKNMDKVKNEF